MPLTTAMWVRDRLDGLWCDEDFVGWYPRDGRPGITPSQPVTVCVPQCLLGLPDRQAAEAVRCRIDLTYAPAMEFEEVARTAEHLPVGLVDDGWGRRLVSRS